MRNQPGKAREHLSRVHVSAFHRVAAHESLDERNRRHHGLELDADLRSATVHSCARTARADLSRARESIHAEYATGAFVRCFNYAINQAIADDEASQ